MKSAKPAPAPADGRFPCPKPCSRRSGMHTWSLSCLAERRCSTSTATWSTRVRARRLSRGCASAAVPCGGRTSPGVRAKAAILRVIRDSGAGAATGHCVEYRGSLIRSLSMAERMTICNMSIEAGARAGLITPDQTTFDYVTAGNRPFAPKGDHLERMIATWRTLKTDPDATFDTHYVLQAAEVQPQVTWGTSPA